MTEPNNRLARAVKEKSKDIFESKVGSTDPVTGRKESYRQYQMRLMTNGETPLSVQEWVKAYPTPK